jgi:hypothetical protein
MKLVYGDQVIENATVTVQPHNKAQRTKQLIELTVPADASNGGYAVRQLLGQDPDIGAKSVVMLEVALTQQQIDRLKNITQDELREIRNGVNPSMIYGVQVYDSEPMDVEELITGKKWPRWFTLPAGLKDSTGNEMICIRRDSSQSGETFCLGGARYLWHEWHGDDLQLEEITEQEAQAIIAHSVKPTGETVSQWPKFFVHDGTVYPDMWLLEQTTEEWGFAYFYNRPKVQWRFSSNGPKSYYRQISHAEAIEISADVAVGKMSTVNVKPTGEWLGCVQWFQHSNPNVIIRRDSHDRCTYFEQGFPAAKKIRWDEQASRCIKSGQWTEITQHEAEQRMPWMCKREQYAGGGTPSPRDCDVCLEGPCPRVIPVQCDDDSDPAFKALLTLAQQAGFDSAGMSPKDIADRLIAANQRIAAETSSLQQTVERSFEQLPADRDAVIRLKELVSAKDQQMWEFPVEQVDVPRAGIDQVSLIDSADWWNEICDDNVWNKATWAARRHNFKIRCLPQHVPPARNVAVLWPEPLSASPPDLAFVGVDYAQGPDISATVAVTTEPEQQIVELTVHSVLTPGCWVIAFSHKEHFVVEVSTEQKLNGPIPAAKLSGPIGVKFPLRHRVPVMPKDYGRQVVCRDMENFSIYDVKTGTLQGFDPVKKVFMVAEQNGNHMMYRRENEVWIIDHPTEGF